MTNIYVDKSVADVCDLHRQVLQADRSQLTIGNLLGQQVQNILSGHASGKTAVTFHLGCWCSDFIGKSRSDILSAKLTLEQAQQTIAAEYGFSDWADVQSRGNVPFDLAFERAVDCVVTGALSQLTTMLERTPALCLQRSQFPHAATLLHYVAANGVETHRQMTPLNAAAIARCLIDTGADVNAEANMYGGGSTTIGLLLTSAHPANAGVVDQVADVLRAAGARE